MTASAVFSFKTIMLSPFDVSVMGYAFSKKYVSCVYIPNLAILVTDDAVPALPPLLGTT